MYGIKQTKDLRTMDIRCSITHHPCIQFYNIDASAIGLVRDFIDTETTDTGAVHISFNYKEPYNMKTASRLHVNLDYERVINVSKEDVGIVWSNNLGLELCTEVLVFNDPLECLSYISLRKNLDLFTGIAILPRTFKREHILIVKELFPFARPVCSFGQGQLASLQDAQFYLVHTERDMEIDITYGLDGIKISDKKGKVRFYDVFSLRCLIRDFYGNKYKSGPITIKPLKKYKSFKVESCQKK